MPSIDLKVAYTRAPAKPTPAFPNRKEIWTPLLEVALLRPSGTGFRVKALLDTGAFMNLFPLSLADALGLDWESAPTTPIAGVHGAGPDAHVLPVRVELWDVGYAFTTDIGFLATPQPLLGHHGFFEHFEARFRTSARQVRICRK